MSSPSMRLGECPIVSGTPASADGLRLRQPTIYDVAKAAGVSKSSVSLVLQGSPRVSAEKRAAVRRAFPTV